jgi:thiol:disulfide interchange protein DsbD
LLGGLIMFAMALGMGVILIVVGVGLGSLLPKAGAWMDRVKQVFGVLLLAVAIYLLGMLPRVPVLLLWAVLLIVTGVYLGATQTLPQGASGWRYLWKGLGTVLIIWGVAALIGGFTGGHDIMHPLPDWRSSGIATETTGENLFQRVTTLAEVEASLESARAQHKPAILDFYATWCTDCVRMEKGVFTDARVRERLGDFVLVQADVTENDDNARAIKDRFGVFGPPAMLIFDANGNEMRDLRFYGYKSVDEFLAHLAAVGPKS